MSAPTQKIIIEAGKANSRYWKDVLALPWIIFIAGLARYFSSLQTNRSRNCLGACKTFINYSSLCFCKVDDRRAGTRRRYSYPLVIAAGMLAWSFFSTAVGEISNSLVSNSNLISKVYFPRIIIPLSVTVVCFIDFLVSLIIIIGMMFFYHFVPGWQIVYLPLFFILAVLCAMGIGLFFAAFSVKYRDFRFIVPFIIQFGMYASPVIFSTSEFLGKAIIPGWIKTIYAFNPMVGVIDGFRWCFFGGNFSFDLFNFSVSIAVCLFFLIVGIYSFRKLENEFADVI